MTRSGFGKTALIGLCVMIGMSLLLFHPERLGAEIGRAHV